MGWNLHATGIGESNQDPFPEQNPNQGWFAWGPDWRLEATIIPQIRQVDAVGGACYA